MYKCEKIEGKGDGLRANTDIKYGTVIITEEPVMQVGKIVIKKANPWRQLEKFPESMQESMKTQLEEKLLLLNETSEQYLKEYFDKLSSDKQNALMQLYKNSSHRLLKSLQLLNQIFTHIRFLKMTWGIECNTNL